MSEPYNYHCWLMQREVDYDKKFKPGLLKTAIDPITFLDTFRAPSFTIMLRKSYQFGFCTKKGKKKQLCNLMLVCF